MAGPSSGPEQQYLGLYSKAWSDDLAEQASVVFLVGDVRLPAHKEILMLRSRVLCGMLADLGPQEGPIVLEAPFHGFSAHQVARLLRFIYHPQLITPAGIAELRQDLAPLLRLAHKLDIPILVEAISKHVIETTKNASVETLVQSAGMAQACQLDRLHATCVCAIARKLVTKGDKGKSTNINTALHSARQLRQCDQSMLLQIIAVLAASAPAGSVDLQGKARPDLLQAAASQILPKPVAASNNSSQPEPLGTPPASDHPVEMLLQDYEQSST